LTLSRAERAEVERHVADLDALLDQTPSASATYEEATLVVVTKLMLALPASAQNETGVEATGEAFQMALDDVPTWAVAAAARRWYRGECGEGFDYHWRPAPAELRRIAMLEKAKVQHRAATLRKVLAADPVAEFSDAHCAAMLARLSKVVPAVLAGM
jgi:hypothetical protein